MRSRKGAARAAQVVLVENGSSIAIDGRWGPKSHSAYEASPKRVQRSANDAALAYGFTIDELKPVGANWISEQEVIPLIERAAAVSGRDISIAWDFLNLEASRRRDNGIIYYNAASVAPSGLFFGLMQMGRPAWTDVVRYYPDTPAFEVGRFDPYASILAGLRLSVINERSLKKMGYRGPFTTEVMYAAHNQGAAGFMSLLKTKTASKNFENQSVSAKRVIAAALMANGVVLA